MKHPLTLLCIICIAFSQSMAVTLPYSENFESESTCDNTCNLSYVLNTTG